VILFIFIYLHLGVLEAEAAEADHVEYFRQLGDVARVVNGHRQLDETEMAFVWTRDEFCSD
jgi:hypothetical protein